MFFRQCSPYLSQGKSSVFGEQIPKINNYPQVEIVVGTARVICRLLVTFGFSFIPHLFIKYYSVSGTGLGVRT